MKPKFSKAYMRRVLGVGIAIVLLAIDLATKRLALTFVRMDEAMEVVPGFLGFRLAWNRGVSFSFLNDLPHAWLPLVLAGLALAVSGFLVYWIGKADRYLYLVGLACILGGAVGNAIDRITYGAVVDFIHVYHGQWVFPTFNVADSVITVGVLCVLLDTLLATRQQKNKET